MPEGGRELFYEVQNFRRSRWILFVITPISAFLVVFFTYAIIRQLIMGIPVGDKPLSNIWLAIVAPFFIALGVLLFWLFLTSRLETRVTDKGLFIRFYPFHIRKIKIPLEEIEDFQVCSYNPVLDYGGWGIRYGAKGKAYNVSGNRGVRLTFRDGTTLLIGSQRSEEFAQALSRAIGYPGKMDSGE